MAAALASFPFVQQLWQVYAFAVAMAASGGVVTVVFFAVWRSAFGEAHLGQIQGAAQMLTVLASALGPLVLAWCKQRTDSYLIQFGAGLAVLMALTCWHVPMPRLAVAAQPTRPMDRDGVDLPARPEAAVEVAKRR